MSEPSGASRDKYQSPPSISQIVPGIFIGNDRVTWFPEILTENNIKAIVSMIHAPWGMWSQKRFRNHAPPGRHMWIECVDSSTQDLLFHMERGCDFIEEMLRPLQQSASADLSLQSPVMRLVGEGNEASNPPRYHVYLHEGTEHLQPPITALDPSDPPRPATAVIKERRISQPPTALPKECEIQHASTGIIQESRPSQSPATIFKESEPTLPPTPVPEEIESARPPSNVLVHRSMGVSRSTALVIAYLMRKLHKSRDEILAEVRTKRRVKPSVNFMDQLDVWEQVGYQIWEDDAKKIPKPAYKAYLGRRAAALKIKGLTGNEPLRPLSL